MRIERSGSAESLDKYKEEIKNLQMEVKRLKEKNIGAPEPANFVGSENEIITEDKVIEIHEDKGSSSYPVDVALSVIQKEDAQSPAVETLNQYADKHEDAMHGLLNPTNADGAIENILSISEQNVDKQEEDSRLQIKLDSVNDEATSEKTASPFYSCMRKPSNIIHHFLVSSCLVLTFSYYHPIMYCNIFNRF